MNFNKAEFFASYGFLSQIPPSERIEIAFAGRSNVGKSSLINKIFNRKKLAKVSSVPGKTVTINFFDLENIYLVDLPGYGYAKVAKTEKTRWADLIEGYLNDTSRDLALVFSLVDMRHPSTEDDVHMINFLVDNEIPFVVVLTKADKLNKTQREKRLEDLKTELPYYNDITVIPFSSITAEGVDEIKGIIEDVALEE
ncbi:MAG: YihA family ribosome biogenesis GTP-binding protein [Clostridiales bacterium]|nr:YihA family ribosome biogenesis GTP-binding protein [Clostridiales bacterium]